MKTTKAVSRNKFTSALLVLTIGLNGCAMMQPTAMSGEYTRLEAAPPPPPPPSLRDDTVCMASNGDTLRLSANFDCVANGFTRPPSIDDRTLDAQRREQAINDSFDAPTVQTTTGGPVYVHGYTRANGTYVAPYTRRR